jgi:hypothetical protein
MTATNRIFRVTLSALDVPVFLQQCEASEWYAFDTGERIMTDEGPDAEAVLLVEPAVVQGRPVRAALVH